MKKVRDLNDIRITGHLGLHKKSLCLNKNAYNLLNDNLEKINFSIQDINKLLDEIKEKPPRDGNAFILILVMICWIKEASKSLSKFLSDYAIQNFYFSKQKELDLYNKYIDALRSFIFAHPFDTNRHSAYGFNGSLRCIDIRARGGDITEIFWKEEDKFFIDENGVKQYNKESAQYVIYFYNNEKYDNVYKQYMYISLDNLCKIANCYIDYVYELDKHLSKVKVQKSNN